MASILIVDDERDLVELVKVILAREGHALRDAGDGAEALAVLGIDPPADTGFRPDLVLVDVWMPNVDGPTLAKRLSEHPRTASVPVLVLTAKDQAAAQFAALKNVAGFIAKPFEPKDLRDAIARVVGPR